MKNISTLTHTEAGAILATIQAVLEEKQKGAAIAIADAHGELIAFLKTDGCPLPSIQNAINKAFTSAREGIPSKVLGNASRKELFPMTNFGDLRYIGWGGGLPLIKNGEVVGAVGVSGLPEMEDIDLAGIGVAFFESEIA
ncbi:MAG: heme-binding protein [Rhodothermales bacterium]